MTFDTKMTLALLQKLLLALRANDPDDFKTWLSLGIERLGEPAVIELMVDWVESILTTDEAERLVLEPGSNFFLSSAEGQSQLQTSKPSATQVEVTTSQHGNPSMRRDGIRIAFVCENCTTLPELIIVQHKDATQLQWEYESPLPQMTEQTRHVATF